MVFPRRKPCLTHRLFWISLRLACFYFLTTLLNHCSLCTLPRAVALSPCAASPYLGQYPHHRNTEMDISREPFQSKRTTKTFTGCWTCRTRKIKCDEGKPLCRQCTSKNLACEGYGVRLQWITEFGDSNGRWPSSGQGGGRSQRSKIAFGMNRGSLLPALLY